MFMQSLNMMFYKTAEKHQPHLRLSALHHYYPKIKTMDKVKKRNVSLCMWLIIDSDNAWKGALISLNDDKMTCWLWLIALDIGGQQWIPAHNCFFQRLSAIVLWESESKFVVSWVRANRHHQRAGVIDHTTSDNNAWMLLWTWIIYMTRLYWWLQLLSDNRGRLSTGWGLVACHRLSVAA